MNESLHSTAAVSKWSTLLTENELTSQLRHSLGLCPEAAVTPAKALAATAGHALARGGKLKLSSSEQALQGLGGSIHPRLRGVDFLGVGKPGTSFSELKVLTKQL